MLHWRRKQQEELARKEAEGVSFWTDSFDKNARTRIFFAFSDCAGQADINCAAFARGLMLRSIGIPYLVEARISEWDDLERYVRNCPDEMFPTAVEALMAAVRALYGNQVRERAAQFQQLVNEILREHRISFELVGGEMVVFSSREMHEAVVSPTLRLLASGGEWDKVERAYRAALAEISHDKPSDAITDCGTALQEALELLGCQGNALGPLIRSAKSKGLLANHDGTLTEGIEKILHWVSADRSESGDAHKANVVGLDDAWFTVHVVGAILLRLSRGGNRG